jgi:hypothetical protein
MPTSPKPEDLGQNLKKMNTTFIRFLHYLENAKYYSITMLWFSSMISYRWPVRPKYTVLKK